MTVFKTKEAQAVIEALTKLAFTPAPGGNMDPAAMGGVAPAGMPPQGGMPMDPYMGGQPPMDPSMMGGDPAMAGMVGMDPTAGGMSTDGKISIADVAKLYKLFAGGQAGAQAAAPSASSDIEGRLARIEQALAGGR